MEMKVRRGGCGCVRRVESRRGGRGRRRAVAIGDSEARKSREGARVGSST